MQQTLESGLEKLHRGRGSMTSCNSLPPTRVYTTIGIYKVSKNIVSEIYCFILKWNWFLSRLFKFQEEAKQLLLYQKSFLAELSLSKEWEAKLAYFADIIFTSDSCGSPGSLLS